MSGPIPVPTTGVVVANPRSGGLDGDLLRRVVERCRALLGGVEVVTTEYPGHAEQLAAKLCMPGGPEVVVAVGGDGTAHEVATGLYRAGALPARGVVPLLLPLPAGTGNSFHRELWGERSWEETLDAAFDGTATRRDVDLGRIVETDTPALLGAGSGLVAEALAVAPEVTELTGRARYDKAVALTIAGFTPYPGRVVVDGRLVHEGPTVFANVGGGRHRGGRHRLLPHSVIDDGLLDVCVVDGSFDLRELPAVTPQGRHVDRAETVYARGRRVTIERTDGVPLTFEYDGELLRSARTSYTVEVVPGAVPVLAPPACVAA